MNNTEYKSINDAYKFYIKEGLGSFSIAASVRSPYCGCTGSNNIKLEGVT